MEDFQPDIVEIGSPYLTPWFVKWCYRSYVHRRPLLLGFYHADFPRADIYQLTKGISERFALGAQKLAESYARFLYTRLDHNIATTPMVRDRLLELGIEKVAVLPFGVDTTVFTPVEEPTTSLDGPIKLLYVGRLSVDKRILPFIDVMQTVLKNRQDIELDIIGSGYLRDAIKQRIANLPNVRLLDFIATKKELARQYSKHDLLIVTNPFETFCIAALECMACGTPVASMRAQNGGIQALINDKTGFLLDGDLDAFAPFLGKINRRQLLAMRSGVRLEVMRTFDRKLCYRNLFNFYESAFAKHMNRNRLESNAVNVSA